jgi:hypothetical protein
VSVSSSAGRPPPTFFRYSLSPICFRERDEVVDQVLLDDLPVLPERDRVEVDLNDLPVGGISLP